MYRRRISSKTSTSSSPSLSQKNSPFVNPLQSQPSQKPSSNDGNRESPSLMPLIPSKVSKKSHEGNKENLPNSGKQDSNREKSYFEQVLEQAGLEIQLDENCHVLNKELPIIVRDTEKILQSGEHPPKNVKDFMKSFKHHLTKEEYFKKALSATQLIENTEDEIITSSLKENLFRILLMVESIQEEIIDYLLEKITDIAIELKEDETSSICLLLRPLRFLPHIQNKPALTTQYLEIIEAASPTAQLELITFLPDIFPDSEHDGAGQNLSKLVNDNSQLTLAVIQCLEHLNLGSVTRAEVRNRLLESLQHVIPLENIPILTQYLLATMQQQDNISEVIVALRNALDFSVVGKSHPGQRETSQTLTFSAIQTAFMRSKNLVNEWIKTIMSIKIPSNHKPNDIAILFVLYSIGSGRKKIVETVFKKRIQSGLFTPSLLETTIKSYLTMPILSEYLQPIIEIASSLMQIWGGNLIAEFATSFFILLFSHPEASAYQRQEVIHTLVLITNGFRVDAIPRTLNTLNILCENYGGLLQNHALLLLGLMNNIERLDLTRVRQIMNILCSLAFSSDQTVVGSTLQDDLLMLVRKQLGSSNKDIQFKGITGAVMAIKHIVSNESTEEVTPLSSKDSYTNVDDLPDERARDAANLIILISSTIRGHLEALGFLYDQLAISLGENKYVNKFFSVWLTERMIGEFQNTFIVEKIPTIDDDIEFSMQYCVNDPDEGDPIAINIGALSFEHDSNKRSILITLPPLIRLIRVILTKQNQNDLNQIDAVLGCSIIMPEIDPDLGIKQLDLDLVANVIEAQFHCANWFREIISAFVTQTNPNLHRKVLFRLANLIQLEKQLAQFLLHVPPDFKAPPCQFPVTYRGNSTFLPEKKIQNKPKPMKPPAKKRKKNQKDDSTSQIDLSSIAGPSQMTNKTEVEIIDPGSVHRNCFRDLDIDVITFLKEDFILGESSETPTPGLSIVELKFILEDIVSKIQSILKGSEPNKFGNQIPLNPIFQHIKPADLIQDCVKLMPFIVSHFDSVSSYLQNLLELSDGVRDASGIYVPGSEHYKQTFSLLLEFKSLTFSWFEHQTQDYLDLLRVGLRSLLDKEHQRLKSIGELVLKVTSKYIKLADLCLYLPMAVNLIKFLEILANLSNESAPQKQISNLCENLLSMSWMNLKGKIDRGAAYNVQIDFLVKTYLKEANVEKVQQILVWIHDEAPLLKISGDCLQTFPSIQKPNFPILFRGVCTALVNAAKAEVDATNRHLNLWREIAISLHGLAAIVKIQEHRSNLTSFLRRSLDLMKLFLAKGMPILEIKLRSQPEAVTEILRIFQKSTRFIQSLCCHLKVKGDASLMTLVPFMRSTLEALIYRVKAALIANNCSAAFWMGVLVNKDIHGEEILSQVTQEPNENNAEEDFLPPDDEDSDVEDEESVLDSDSDKRKSDIF